MKGHIEPNRNDNLSKTGHDSRKIQKIHIWKSDLPLFEKL